MKLSGSCHCGKVTFSLESAHPYPFNLCYCSICRKTAGGGGYAINLGGDAQSMEVTGKAHVTVYQAMIDNAEGEREKSPAERHFCAICSTNLWAWDPRWPKLIHPFASAIDSALPYPPERTHLMLGSKADWVPVLAAPQDKQFDEYPDESIADWHERLDVTC